MSPVTNYCLLTGDPGRSAGGGVSERARWNRRPAGELFTVPAAAAAAVAAAARTLRAVVFGTQSANALFNEYRRLRHGGAIWRAVNGAVLLAVVVSAPRDGRRAATQWTVPGSRLAWCISVAQW